MPANRPAVQLWVSSGSRAVIATPTPLLGHPWCNMMHETYRVDPDPDLGRLKRVPPPDVDSLLAAVAGHGKADVAVLVAGMLHQVLERRLDLSTGGARG